MDFQRFCNLFFDFADPTIRRYCNSLSSNRTWKKTHAIGYYKYKKGFSEFGLRTSLLEKAINSSRYIEYYNIISKDFGIKDKRFRLFETKISFDTREAIKGILTLCKGITDGNYSSFAEVKNQPVITNELKKSFTCQLTSITK